MASNEASDLEAVVRYARDLGARWIIAAVDTWTGLRSSGAGRDTYRLRAYFQSCTRLHLVCCSSPTAMLGPTSRDTLAPVWSSSYCALAIPISAFDIALVLCISDIVALAWYISTRDMWGLALDGPRCRNPVRGYLGLALYDEGSSRMRVVIVAPFSPARRHDHAAEDTLNRFVRHLAASVDLHVIAPDARISVGQSVTLDGFTLWSLGDTSCGHIRANASLLPAWLRSNWRRGTTESAIELVTALAPDAVHCEYLQTAEVALAFRSCSLIRLHDVTSQVLRGAMARQARLSVGFIGGWNTSRPFGLAQGTAGRRTNRCDIAI